MSVAYRVDPQLPAIPATDIACPGCRQTLETIRGGHEWLPGRHYVRPMGRRRIIRACHSEGSASRLPDSIDALCSWDHDHLSALIFTEQRNRAGLGAPQAVAS